jgi:hypothetical protein
MFGNEFKVLKNMPKTYIKVGDDYPEYFIAYEKEGKLKYYIIDDNFGYPSLANTHDGNYAVKLRSRSSKILEDLIKEGYIELIESN